MKKNMLVTVLDRVLPTTTAEYAASERNIMAMTGHKSVDMVRRYIKEADLFKNNALNKISDK